MRYIYITLICLNITLSSAMASFLNSPLPSGTPVPTVVLDVDNTICTTISAEKFSPEVIHQTHEEAILVPYYQPTRLDPRGYMPHIFFPGIPELIMTVLSWGWNLHFFSAGIKERNEKVLPVYLRECLHPYVDNSQAVLDQLMQNGRIAIYSRHHMHLESGYSWLATDEDMINASCKNLSRVGLDLEHSILVDDKPSYVPNDQEPLLALNEHAGENFKQHLLGKRQKLQDARHHAAYILGILDRCRKLMNTGLSLRAALTQHMAISADFMTRKSGKWHDFGPGYPFKPTVVQKPSAEYRKEFIQQQILSGQPLIEQMLSKRVQAIQSKRSSTPYLDLLRHMYNVQNHDETPIGYVPPMRVQLGEGISHTTFSLYLLSLYLLLWTITYYTA